MKKMTGSPAEPAGALYVPTDISPEELFEALGRLRREAEAEIERLIDLVDELDGLDEREEAVDDAPCDDEELEADHADDEPSLGACENHVNPSPPGIWLIDGQFRSASGDQSHWTQGNSDEREGDGCADDREEVSEDEGCPTGDNEPSLDWPERDNQCQGIWGDTSDMEQCGRVATPEARRRYDANRLDRQRPHHDGRHVDVERPLYASGTRRIRNLSQGQAALVRPRLDRNGSVGI